MKSIPETIQKLIQLGFAPIPVAPYFSESAYPYVNRKGEIELDKDGKAKPKFTGKNPSYVDDSGKPSLVAHGKYKNKMPTDAELSVWFSNPENGIGTLGGVNGSIWIDFDVKCFDNQEDCDNQFTSWLDNYPQLKECWIESTGSGGYRVLVKVTSTPDFTNFSLELNGKHRGEAIGEGRFTVLAPTKGTNPSQHKDYTVLSNFGNIVEIESLESIGIYPHSAKSKVKAKQLKSESNKVIIPINAVVDLKDLASNNTKAIFTGFEPEDRSGAITGLINEYYGWENWLKAQNISYLSTTEELAHKAGQTLGIDSDRVDRILDGIDGSTCVPSSSYLGGDRACWIKIHKLNDRVYSAYCPSDIKAEISADSLAQKINQYQKQSEILDDLEEYDPTSLRKEIESIKNAKDIWQDIKKSFPKDVIEVFEHFHKHLGTPRELYALTFLTTISGSLNGKYKVLVSSKTNWVEPLNIYTVVIGNKGVNKSAVVNLFCNYHDHKNEEYLLEYREAEKQYKIDYETWKRINKSGDAEAMGESQPEPPILRYSSIGQSTMAKLIQVMDTQRNNYKASLLVSVDELSTILDAVNKFDGGSDDIGRLLEMWNARRVTSSTKGEGTVGTFGMISIIATTQPATWARMMAKHSAHGTNGFNDRFLVGELREEDQKLFDHTCTDLPPHDMGKIMERYSKLFDSLPANQTITINPGLGDLLNQIERWFSEDRSGRAKSKSYIFRLAGVLACLRDAHNPTIQAQDINSAWRLAIYSEACIKSIGGEARETLGAELVSKAANIYAKKGECSYTTLKQGNASAFRGLSKIEMEAIILKVAETVTDGEIVTTRTGSKKLVRVELSTTDTKTEVKKETKVTENKEETVTEISTPLDINTPEPEVNNIINEGATKYKNTLSTLANSDLDESQQPTVECTHTKKSRVEVSLDLIPDRYQHLATSDNTYDLVYESDTSLKILIPTISKPVRINKLKN